MYKLGLKLWSTNNNYIQESIKLYDSKIYDYIELFIVPESYKSYSSIWQNLNIPFIIHAPHYAFGLNLAKKEIEKINLRLARETIKFSNDLNSKTIIFHPGMEGNIIETIRQLKFINNPQIIIENKPYYALPKFGNGKLICNGYSPNDIEKIIGETGLGFCFDIGHAICAANAQKINPLKYIEQFLKLNPKMYHISDGNFDGVHDEHKNLGCGTFPLKKLLDFLSKDSIISIETEKSSKENLEDFENDVIYLKNLFNYGKRKNNNSNNKTMEYNQRNKI